MMVFLESVGLRWRDICACIHEETSIITRYVSHIRLCVDLKKRAVLRIHRIVDV